MQRRSYDQPSISALVNLMGRVWDVAASSSLSRSAFGNGPQHFHFARIRRGDSMASSLATHEHYLVAFLNLNPGMRILELGCRSGGAALEVANFANVTVFGVDADSDKIREATVFAQRSHMVDRVMFMRADLSCLREVVFETFDCIYAIEAFQGLSTFEAAFGQIRELLRPGGKFAIYEWCWTSKFDKEDPDHCRLAELIETTTGVGQRSPYERCIDAAITAIRNSGLKLLHTEDLADRKDERPWYFPLESAISDPRISWHSGANIFGGLDKRAATILVEAGKRKLFTPMALFVGQRP